MLPRRGGLLVPVRAAGRTRAWERRCGLPSSEKLRKPTDGFKPLPKETVSSFIFPKIKHRILFLQISVPITQTSTQPKAWAQRNVQHFEVHYSSLHTAFSGLETRVVSANMDFFQERRTKQLFHYKQITLGNKHRNPPGLWRETVVKENQTLSPWVNINIMALSREKGPSGRRG